MFKKCCSYLFSGETYNFVSVSVDTDNKSSPVILLNVSNRFGAIIKNISNQLDSIVSQNNISNTESRTSKVSNFDVQMLNKSTTETQFCFRGDLTLAIKQMLTHVIISVEQANQLCKALKIDMNCSKNGSKFYFEDTSAKKPILGGLSATDPYRTALV